MFAKFEVFTIKMETVRKNSAMMLFFEKPVTFENPTPPTVFAAHLSNFAHILTTRIKATRDETLRLV